MSDEVTEESIEEKAVEAGVGPVAEAVDRELNRRAIDAVEICSRPIR